MKLTSKTFFQHENWIYSVLYILVLLAFCILFSVANNVGSSLIYSPLVSRRNYLIVIAVSQ